MFIKLKTRLMLLNLAVGGVILVAIAVIAYLLISGSIRDQSLQAFQIVLNNVASQETQDKPYAVSMFMKNEGGIMVTAYPYYIFGTDSSGRLPDNPGLPLPSDSVASIEQNVLTYKTEIQGKIGIATGGDIKKATVTVQGKTEDLSTASGETGAQKAFSIMISDDTIKANNTTYRYAAVYSADSTQVVVQDLSDQTSLLTKVGFILVVCVSCGLLLLALGGRFLAERSIRPIRASWTKQREFVADASHELRTPLAAIISNIDVLLDDPNATVQEKKLYCQGIAHESKRMTQLVDGLLLLARADSDALILQKEHVDLATIVRDAFNFMQPEAAGKGIGTALQVKQTPVVSGDADRLKQVLLQLLDNAIKYTPSGGNVELVLDCSREKAVVQVRDNGMGIAREHMDKIFERFYRADASRESEVGGHGLGLAIAKFIVEQHGGTISAVSRQAQGSIFTVTLPMVKEED